MHISTTQLHHLGIESSYEGEMGQRELLTCLARRWKDTLTYIRMLHTTDDGADIEPPNTDPPTITMDTISPLLNLHKLEHLEIDGYALELTDSNVGDMATAWSEIHTLHLPFMGNGTQRPGVSALQMLAERCLALRYLTIPLDANDFGHGQQQEGPKKNSEHPLQVLTVASPDEAWELGRVTRLARVIDHLFPSLVKVKTLEGDRGEGDLCWSQVHQLVKLCQDMRAEATKLYCCSSVV
ncbi:hypothetical protein AN958_08334 [Leucoagaricus sp. SymC.cos]|nr:hypothetical protein AN958_08334 [Leucoagaricus sp. SymC.cos]